MWTSQLSKNTNLSRILDLFVIYSACLKIVGLTITLQLKSSCPKIFDHGCSLLKLWKLSLIKYQQFFEFSSMANLHHLSAQYAKTPLGFDRNNLGVFTAAVPDGFWNISYYNLKLYNCRNRNWKQQILICQQRLKTLSRVLDANSHC